MNIAKAPHQRKDDRALPGCGETSRSAQHTRRRAATPVRIDPAPLLAWIGARLADLHLEAAA